MKQNSILIFAFFIFITSGFQVVSAQFPLKIPKLPKTEKPKQEQPKTEDNGGNQTNITANQSSAKIDGERIYKNQPPLATPVFLKNTVYVQTATHKEYWKMPNERDFSSWIPLIKFSQYYNNDKPLSYTVEYFNPDGSAWFSEALETGTRSAEWTVMFNSSNPYERLKTKSTAGTGVYSFKIIKQETKEVIFQGKFKVGKFSLANRPTEKNKFDFYVDYDWVLPFGMVGFPNEDFELGGIYPQVSVWLKGYLNVADLEGRIFYKGQQIASSKDRESGVSGMDERTSEFALAYNTNHYWKRWQFMWHKVRLDNNGTFNRNAAYVDQNTHYIDKNPGEYVVKIYLKGAQIRELSFTVGADGRIVVPNYSNQIPLPYYRVILPVKILGTEKWDSMGWKTEAFYGNPLAGFNLP